MNQVIFGTVRSYTDLGLMLTDVDVSLPEPRRITVDVPGRDGLLDLTTALTEGTKYKNRTITLTFAMADYQRRWAAIFADITDQIHGKRLNATIQPDTDYYWDAFCSIDLAKSDRNKGTIKIVLDASPFKLKQTQTTYTVIPASIGKSQTCVNSGRMTVTPTFQASAGCTLAFGSITKQLEIGYNTFPDVVFPTGNSNIILTGTTGEVIITYREGSL